jgi:alanine racemase
MSRAGTRAVVDLGALAANHARLRARAGGRELIAVVKADAYGHGAEAVVRRLAREGCRWFAVARVAEVAALRRAGLDVPLLVLGGVAGPAEARAALALRATAVVQAPEQVGWLEEAARSLGTPARVHVEIDTGMRRLGVPAEQAPALLARVTGSRWLALEGVCTHLACADEPDLAPTRAQVDCFRKTLAAARAAGVDPGRVHVANSAGILVAAGAADLAEGDAVRPGLALYGVAPAPHLADPELRPVMTLCTEVAAVRPVAEGDGVGYGHTWRAPRAGWIAVLPLGYADGIPWSAASRGSVVIDGVRHPLAGRVSMDCITVWTGERPARIGEPALVFGAEPAPRVEEWAQAAGTIAYELMVRVGTRVPRVVEG